MKQYNMQQMSILETLNHTDFIGIDENNSEVLKIYHFLMGDKLICCGYKETSMGRMYCAQITEEGKSYLATHGIDFNRFDRNFRWNRGLSIAAILISLVALFQQPLLELLSLLLKCLK